MTGPIATAAAAPGDILLDPALPLLTQICRAWDELPLRPVKNSVVETWRDNGCHPTAAAMAAKWFNEVNDFTKGRLTFPVANPAVCPNPTATPLTVWFSLRDENADTDPTAPRPTPEPGKPRKALPATPRTPMSGPPWNVDHEQVLKDMAKIALQGAANPKGEALTAEVVKLTSDLKGSLLEALARGGPLALNISHPGHYVVCYGLVDNRLFICDPGQVIWALWTGMAQKPMVGAKNRVVFKLLVEPDDKTQGSPGCRFAIDLDHKFQVAKSRKDATVVATVSMKETIKRVEQFFFPSLSAAVMWQPGKQMRAID